MPLIQHIPNLLTLTNVFCGCMALAHLYNPSRGGFFMVVFWVCLGAIFDFLDGAAARKLGVQSALGKQLDSLADSITFGVVPASIAFQLMGPFSIYSYTAFILAMASVLRLARFNLDERQQSYFIGLPTPANTLFWLGLPFWWTHIHSLADMSKQLLLSLLVLLSSYALLSPMILFALKFKNFDWRSNRIRYIFVVLSVACLLVFRWQAISLLVVLYVLISVLFYKPKELCA